MIIKHTNGLDPETNTDKLCDTDALILEKSEELRELCSKSNRQCIIVVDANGRENGDGYHFWNLAMKHMGDSMSPPEAQKAIKNILDMANNFTTLITEGKFVVSLKTEE